jgi:hypothetical protein
VPASVLPTLAIELYRKNAENAEGAVFTLPMATQLHCPFGDLGLNQAWLRREAAKPSVAAPVSPTRVPSTATSAPAAKPAPTPQK